MARNQRINFFLVAMLILPVAGQVTSIHSAEKTMSNNDLSPREISSIARRSAPDLLDGNISTCKICDIGDDGRILNRRQLEAMSPLLIQQVLEASRSGKLYQASRADANRVYVVIPESLAVQLETGLMAELVNSRGKTLAKWTVWESYFAEIEPDPNNEWPGCPVIDRNSLTDVGLMLHLYQVIDDKHVTLARIPLYPDLRPVKEQRHKKTTDEQERSE